MVWGKISAKYNCILLESSDAEQQMRCGLNITLAYVTDDV